MRARNPAPPTNRLLGSIWAGLIGVVVLLLAGCGGSVSDSNSLEAATMRAEGLAEEVTRQFGPDGGFDAVLFALERGYSVSQLFAAIGGRRLEADGNITTKARIGVEPPSEAPLGLVLLPENAVTVPRGSLMASRRPLRQPPAVLAVAQEPPLAIDIFRNQAKREAEKVSEEDLDIPLHTYVVLGWVASGYTPEQMIEALLFGHLYTRVGRECMAIQDLETGSLLSPAGDTLNSAECSVKITNWEDDTGGPATGLAPRGEQPIIEPDSDQANSLAGIYSGTLTLVQCGVDCSIQCEIERPFSLFVSPDNSISGTTPAHARWTLTECLAPTEVGQRIAGQWQADGGVGLEIDSFIDAPTRISGRLEGGSLTLMLDEDTRPIDAGRIVQFDAVLTRE